MKANYKTENEKINELEKKSKINIAKGIANTITTNSAGENKRIKLVPSILLGDKLSFTSDGGIKIGKDVKHVKVSGNIRISSNVNNTRVAVQLSKVKNNNDTIFSSNTIHCPTAGTKYGGAAATTLIEVSEDDVIYLSYYNGTGIVVTADDSLLNSMTVEAVD